MPPALLADILKLSVAERVQLAEDIWDTIAIAPESLDLSEAQRQELDRRVNSYHNDPTPGYSWESIKEEIKNL